MREIDPSPGSDPATLSEAESFRACVAAILEMPLAEIPQPTADEAAASPRLVRSLAGLGLGLVPIADVADFTWPGPWIGLGGSAAGGNRRAVVMYGVPSGMIWDPTGATTAGGEWRLESGYLVSALDIALARPQLHEAPAAAGRVESISIAPAAGERCASPESVRALPGEGLEGDRHVSGHGSFPSGAPGSALTLIEAEVCESFDPMLTPDVHRRNVVTRGIDLNALVGHEFFVGDVRCRGMRLCEPCTVVDGYATEPILRALVHRGGLRADILSEGVITVGDPLSARG